MSVAVVTIVRGRLDHLRQQRRWLTRSHRMPGSHVVVVMGGPDPDDVCRWGAPPVTRLDLDVPVGAPLPLAAARNVGARRAVAQGASVVVFLDVDVLPLPRLVGAFRRAAEQRPDAVHLGPVRHLGPGERPWTAAAWHRARPDPRRPPARPCPMPRPELLWSLSFAVTPATWARIGGFDERYVGYGAEDTDLGMRTAAAGVEVRWAPSARALHQWHTTGDPSLRARDLVRNATTFRDRWGTWPMADWLHELADRGLVRFDPDDDLLELVAG